MQGLAAQVQALGEKVEYIARAAAGGDALDHLEQRIAAIADALAERAQSGAAVPPRLEALVESLSDKIEQMQNSRGNGDAFGHLEDRIVKLVEKLDASDSRLGHLEAIERGLGDLLVHIEDMRANKDAGGLRAQGSPGVDDLKHDIARTQDALEAVHGTLGHVVDRLAMIEKDIRGEARPHSAAEATPRRPPVGKLAVRMVERRPAPTRRRRCQPPPRGRGPTGRTAPAPRRIAAGRPIADRSRSAARSAARARLRAADFQRQSGRAHRRVGSRPRRRRGRPPRPAANPASSPPPAAPPRRRCSSRAPARRAPEPVEAYEPEGPVAARQNDEAGQVAVHRRQHHRHRGRSDADRRQCARSRQLQDQDGGSPGSNTGDTETAVEAPAAELTAGIAANPLALPKRRQCGPGAAARRPARSRPRRRRA